MNKFEKQVFNSLSEEEQGKIAGGGDVGPDDDLTSEQCDKLRNAAANAIKPEVTDLLLQKPMLMYGLPIPGSPHWRSKKRSLQPLDPVTPEETQQNTTSDPNTTDKS